MYVSRIRKVGGSLIVAVPRVILRALRINCNDVVGITLAQQGILIQKLIPENIQEYKDIEKGGE